MPATLLGFLNMSDDDMELPSAMYRTLRSSRGFGKGAKRSVDPPTTGRVQRPRRTRQSCGGSSAATTNLTDDLGKLSALRHFALFHTLPKESPPPETPLDVLLTVMEGDFPPLHQQQVVSEVSQVSETVAPLASDVVMPRADVVMPRADVVMPRADVVIPRADVVVQRAPTTFHVPTTVAQQAQPRAKVPLYVPKKLEQMFGLSVVKAVRQVLEWYTQGDWKHHPCVLWGPCGVGKTLLCTLLAAKFRASFVTYEDELDVMDKVKGWLQSSSRKQTGVLAFSAAPSSCDGSWLLLDDVDSLEGQCRKDVLALMKKCKTLPGPVLLTCQDVFDKAMAPLKALPLTLQLQPHTEDNLSKLVRSVTSGLSERHVSQLAAAACGDARRAIISTQLRQRPDGTDADPTLYHSPFVAAEALFKKPEIASRALDGQEFMVQTLLFQNYPSAVRDMEQLSFVADEWCQFDCLDSLHELPEYTRTYLTYVIPHTALSNKSKSGVRLRLNPKFMNQSVKHKRVSLDWNCMGNK